MKIAIVGAGVIGVTTAHVLAQSGASVHVFEQGSSAAQGASFAQHGVYGGHSVQAMFAPTQLAALHACWWQTPRDLGLMLKAAIGSRRHHRAHTQQLQALAQRSSALMAAYVDPLDLSFEQALGLLTVGTAVELDSLSITAQAPKYLAAEQIAVLQPAMNLADAGIQAQWHSEQGYGNCALFAKQLRAHHAHQASNRAAVVQYHFNHAVESIQSLESLESNAQRLASQTQASLGQATQAPQAKQPRQHSLSNTPQQARWQINCQLTAASAASIASTTGLAQHHFDAVVVCAGASTAALIADLNLKYPVLPTCAYSVTFAIDSMLDAPRSAVRDAHSGSVLVPIGQRLRVSGQHHIGTVRRAKRQAYKTLIEAAQHWFPFAAKVSDATYDTSHSCVAIDSKPIIGQTAQAGVYVNFAHGAHAWALAFGSAQLLADAMLPATFNSMSHFHSPSEDVQAFSPNRFA
jgi:D-amino-acid dehydrogenase